MSDNEGTPIEGEANPEEAKARANGWKPKEEFNGPEEQWRPAKEFNERGEMIGNLIKEQKDNSHLRKEINELRDSIRLLSEHNSKVAEKARADAIAELKSLKKEALKDGDADTVIEVDDKLAEIRDAERQQVQQPKPDVSDWLAQNQWYEKEATLRASFDGIVGQVLQQNPELKGNADAVLETATALMKETFPERFGKTRGTAQPVLDPQEPAKTAKKGKYTARDLSPEQKQIAQQMINNGAKLSLDDWAKQLGDLGELA